LPLNNGNSITSEATWPDASNGGADCHRGGRRL